MRQNVGDTIYEINERDDWVFPWCTCDFYGLLENIYSCRTMKIDQASSMPNCSCDEHQQRISQRSVTKIQTLAKQFLERQLTHKMIAGRVPADPLCRMTAVLLGAGLLGCTCVEKQR